MRRRLFPVLAGFAALAANCVSASAHDGYGRSLDDVYAALDRQQAARERREAKAEERAFKRVMARQRYLARARDRAEERREAFERRWTAEANRVYTAYERYCDCAPYREYAEGPRVYGYTQSFPFSYAAYPPARLNDRWWKPDDYPTGWSAWWLRMDREGRSGRN